MAAALIVANQGAPDSGYRTAPMRAALGLLADEALFSSCAMLPTGEGMAVAVRH